MIPYAFGSSDGLFNLGSALSFVQVLPPGVYIAMNGRCFEWDGSERTVKPGYSRPYDGMTSTQRTPRIRVLFRVFRVLRVLRGRGVRCSRLDEATRLLQEYVRIDTSNPPGDTRKAADFLAAIFEREGIPVTRYESAPGKAIVYARLKATVSPPAGKAIVLLHHMDVVPADRVAVEARSVRATIQGNELWGRGAMDMKGQGIAHARWRS